MDSALRARVQRNITGFFAGIVAIDGRKVGYNTMEPLV